MPRLRRLRIDRQAPQRRAALGVAEGAEVVDAGDRADDLAGLLVLGDEVGDRAASRFAQKKSGGTGTMLRAW